MLQLLVEVDHDDRQSDVELNEFNKYNSNNDSQRLSNSDQQTEENYFSELDQISKDYD